MSQKALLFLPVLALALVAALVLGERSDAATGAPAAAISAVAVPAAQEAGVQEQVVPEPEPRGDEEDRSASEPRAKRGCEGKKGSHDKGKGDADRTTSTTST